MKKQITTTNIKYPEFKMPRGSQKLNEVYGKNKFCSVIQYSRRPVKFRKC